MHPLTLLILAVVAAAVIAAGVLVMRSKKQGGQQNRQTVRFAAQPAAAAAAALPMPALPSYLARLGPVDPATPDLRGPPPSTVAREYRFRGDDTCCQCVPTASQSAGMEIVAAEQLVAPYPDPEQCAACPVGLQGGSRMLTNRVPRVDRCCTGY